MIDLRAAALAAGVALAAAGHWEGAIDVPGHPIAVRIDLAATGPAAPTSAAGPTAAAPSGAGGSEWSGSIDIPAQGASGLALDAITVEGAKVRFSIHGVAGAPTFDGTLAAASLNGTFTQGGASFPFHLERTTAGAHVTPAPLRPQEPKPPFPYRRSEASYRNGDIRLAGTLTMPDGPGPFPAVLLITGSGAQNRDEEIFGHKPFLVIADHLSRHGIAVLRVDDRGVGGSSGANDSSTEADFAADVLAGVRFLASQPEIDSHRIGLLGHSEGGLVAPLAAQESAATAAAPGGKPAAGTPSAPGPTRRPDIAFIILLAGPGLPGDQIVMSQTEWLLRHAAVPAATLQQRLDFERRILDLVRGPADGDTLRSQLKPVLQEGLAQATPAERSELGDDAGEFVSRSLRTLSSAWYRSFVRSDPRPLLRQVRVPILALGGDKDFQVPAAANLAAIADAAGAGGNRDVTTQLLPGLNHLFQSATTGGIEEYGAIEETLSPAVLDIITRWITDRFAVKPAAPTATPAH